MRAHASGFPNDMHPFAVEHDPLDKFGGNELFFVKGRALKIKPPQRCRTGRRMQKLLALGVQRVDPLGDIRNGDRAAFGECSHQPVDLSLDLQDRPGLRAVFSCRKQLHRTGIKAALDLPRNIRLQLPQIDIDRCIAAAEVGASGAEQFAAPFRLDGIDLDSVAALGALEKSGQPRVFSGVGAGELRREAPLRLRFPISTQPCSPS